MWRYLMGVLLFFVVNYISANENVKLQLLWKHQFQFAGYYMAIEKGFYAAEGLDVTLKEFDAGVNLVGDTLKGETDFAVGRTSLLIEKNAGADIVALFAAFQQSPLMLLSLESSGIRLSSDLAGKNVMITDDAHKVGEIIAMLLQAGITSSDYNKMHHSYQIKDLIDGKTDAMASYVSNEPYHLDQQGIQYNVIHPNDYGFDMYSDILFTSRRYMEQNPELTERFYQASIRGWQYAFNHIDETAQVIFDKYNSQNKSLDALRYEGSVLKTLAFDSDGNFGTLTESKFNEMAQVYLIIGSIYRGYDFSDFIYQPPDNRYRLNQNELKLVNSKYPIRLCINPNWFPNEAYIDGIHQGMISDYIKLILENVGLQYKIIPSRSWRDTLNLARTGRCQMIAGAMQTIERSDFLHFSRPYLSIPAVVATAKSQQNLNIQKATIGVTDKSAFHEILKNRYPEAEMIAVDTPLTGLKLLQLGKIDAFVGTDAGINHLLQAHQMWGIKISDELHDNWDISVATVLGQPDLSSLIEKSIQSITPAQKEEVLQRWMAVDYYHQIDYTLLWRWIIAFIVIALFGLYRYLTVLKYNKKLKQIAEKDSLTGILSRHKLRAELESFIDLADRHSWSLSVIYFDIDDFKQINDTFGHGVGDRVLIDLTKQVSSITRRTDRFGRWGGEEFLFLLLETHLDRAVSIAEKIRLDLESLHLAKVDTVTCSFGVAEYMQGESIEALLQRADNALYDAKAAGKNCVRMRRQQTTKRA